MSNAARKDRPDQQHRRASADRPAVDRERDREPAAAPHRESNAAWTTLGALVAAGTNADAVMAVESWCFEHGLDSHAAGFTVGGRGSRILRLRGDCYICRRPHANNHWVIVESPGYTTSRIVCHSTGRNATGPHFGV